MSLITAVGALGVVLALIGIAIVLCLNNIVEQLMRIRDILDKRKMREICTNSGDGV